MSPGTGETPLPILEIQGASPTAGQAGLAQVPGAEVRCPLMAVLLLFLVL